MSVTWEVMKQRQALPLEAKIVFTQKKIREWYEYWRGDVYVSFSGGKDSTVLLDIVKAMYPDVPAVFCDTGLEYPEVRELAIKKADVVLKPEMTFKAVLEHYGYPIVGKKQARMIWDLQNESESNKAVCELHRTGYTKDGKYSPSFKLAQRWLPLVDAPFKVSERCCNVMKKDPMKKYENETDRKPFIATMTEESQLREQSYLKYGCNAFESNRPKSTPMAIWLEQDVLQYIVNNELEYASCYGEIKQLDDGSLITTKERRTGCMFCMFGIQYDGTPNRFQRMERDYPKQYDYCINKLGIGAVLDYVGIPYKYQPTLFEVVAE